VNRNVVPVAFAGIFAALFLAWCARPAAAFAPDPGACGREDAVFHASALRASSRVALHPGSRLHRHRYGLHATRHLRRHRAVAELSANRSLGLPPRTAPLPHPAPARAPHPRAALPVLVRPGHHTTSGGGARWACLPPGESRTLSLIAARIAFDHHTSLEEIEHRPNAARGPPRLGAHALSPAFFARSRSTLSPAQFPPAANPIPISGPRTRPAAPSATSIVPARDAGDPDSRRDRATCGGRQSSPPASGAREPRATSGADAREAATFEPAVCSPIQPGAALLEGGVASSQVPSRGGVK
jgi:hypothetical protein